MSAKAKTVVLWALLIVLFWAVYQLAKSPEPTTQSAADAIAAIEDDRVLSFEFDQGAYVFTEGEGERYRVPATQEVVAALAQAGILQTRTSSHGLFAMSWLLYPILIVVFLGLIIYFMRRQSGSKQIFSVGKSRARIIPDDRKATFGDVGGAEEAKRQMEDVVDYLKRPKEWQKAGVRPPRGVLLEGPPGSGKTLLARALAGEAGVPFFVVSASEFVELFVGVGAARVRDMFEEAKKKAPCVLFIDELDAVGRRRGTGLSPSHDEREQTLNQLLVSLDGFDSHKDVIVVAATNRPDVLDQALLRPGRFDRRIRLGLPDRPIRKRILEIHTKGRPLDPSLELDEIAQKTEGVSGASLESLVNEAALSALRRTRGNGHGGIQITMEDFTGALKVVLPPDTIFTKLDALLIESASQIAQPTGRAVVRLELESGQRVEGELLWADGTFLKIKDGERSIVIPKSSVRHVEALPGTSLARAADVVADPWAHRTADVG